MPYRQEVLDQLAIHGVRPHDDTPPEIVRQFLSDLYRYEIRVLRRRLLAGEFPEDEYIGRVVELRNRYLLLGIPTRLWVR